ncbi:hypothetical protein WICPIJ_008810 [Wickerhamomyces pijperi]|uniref:Uncharacterized protein n=1 Tax=Wickerhamomyces pijperi TaxID=599730 RepID=A0A9P8PUY6_WICPI|nr:hypothetical protein WICPIJ_008810 [Wickerhamomyces pijperi]
MKPSSYFYQGLNRPPALTMFKGVKMLCSLSGSAIKSKLNSGDVALDENGMEDSEVVRIVESEESKEADLESSGMDVVGFLDSIAASSTGDRFKHSGRSSQGVVTIERNCAELALARTKGEICLIKGGVNNTVGLCSMTGIPDSKSILKFEPVANDLADIDDLWMRFGDILIVWSMFVSNFVQRIILVIFKTTKHTINTTNISNMANCPRGNLQTETVDLMKPPLSDNILVQLANVGSLFVSR